MSEITVVAKNLPEAPQDDRVRDEEGLTVRERAFVLALAGPAKADPEDAAKLAGITKAQMGKYLNTPHVQRALARALKAKNFNADWAKASISELCDVSMADFLTIDENGEENWDMKKAQYAGAIGAIKSYHCKEDSWVDKDGTKHRQVDRKIELYNKQESIKLLAELLGMIDRDNQVKILNVTIRGTDELTKVLSAKKHVPRLTDGS